MEEEDFLLDAAWNFYNNLLDGINAIETKAQVVMVANGLLLPLMDLKMPIIHIFSIRTILFLIPIISFILALSAIIDTAGSIRVSLIDMRKSIEEADLKQAKLGLARLIDSGSEKIIKIGNKKFQRYRYSSILFVASISLISGIIVGLVIP